MKGMTRGELLALPAATDVQTAARALSIGRTLAYELIAADEFPVRMFRVGIHIRVVTESLLEFLGIDRDEPLEDIVGAIPRRPTHEDIDLAFREIGRRLAERFAGPLDLRIDGWPVGTTTDTKESTP